MDLRYLGFVLCLAFGLAGCSGENVEPASPTPQATEAPIAINPVASGTVVGLNPSPAVLTDADLPALSWTKLNVPPSDLNTSPRPVYGDPHVLDLENGELYQLVEQRTYGT